MDKLNRKEKLCDFVISGQHSEPGSIHRLSKEKICKNLSTEYKKDMVQID